MFRVARKGKGSAGNHIFISASFGKDTAQTDGRRWKGIAKAFSLLQLALTLGYLMWSSPLWKLVTWQVGTTWGLLTRCCFPQLQHISLKSIFIRHICSVGKALWCWVQGRGFNPSRSGVFSDGGEKQKQLAGATLPQQMALVTKLWKEIELSCLLMGERPKVQVDEENNQGVCPVESCLPFNVYEHV